MGGTPEGGTQQEGGHDRREGHNRREEHDRWEKYDRWEEHNRREEHRGSNCPGTSGTLPEFQSKNLSRTETLISLLLSRKLE